jgi:hypothetical protein|tara:strand:- start:897 stop:1145 length:249 start_codon:yes stop_codon:yes gene_type:complete
MKYFIAIVVFIFIILNTTSIVLAKQPKAKFYDFNEQIIDGEIKKPTTLYTDSRQRVKFGRLLRLKKSFMPKLFDTSKERVFK